MVSCGRNRRWLLEADAPRRDDHCEAQYIAWFAQHFRLAEMILNSLHANLDGARCSGRSSSIPEISSLDHFVQREEFMGRGILQWLLGVPIPVIILIAFLYR